MATYDEDEIILGFGKQIAFSATENGTFIKIAGTTSVTLPERELGNFEFTNDDSPAFHKQYRPALYEPGTASFSYRYTASQYAELEELFQRATDADTRDTAVVWWKVTLPDGAISKFKGFMVKHPLPIEMEEGPTVEVEIQVDGPMTYTASVGS